MAPGIYLCSC